MPHQLRRIITVNIRNPNGGLPSGRISELDPRGGVLAVGDNGVGKTTFLRLLPLFYGATPSQVLKGSGRSSMISYTLPDESSAVAYEYERESAEDLRCVVMHAKANEEAPVFHIIHGGFREDYFYDENNQYVGRDEFKARVEAIAVKEGTAVEVTRRLNLHQYRSVILNERLPTKEGVELRRLAAVHSLGPRALYNLDQIAAAMANEKINFRDLQNIVLERVSDAHTVGVKPSNVRELKQNREAVFRWLEARTHLAEILKRKPDASRIKERIGKVKRLHLELCSLHVAVKSAIDQASQERTLLEDQHKSLSAQFKQDGSAIQATILGLEQTKAQADTTYSEKHALVAAALSRKAHFERINAKALATLEETESDLVAKKVSKEGERDHLTKIASDAKAQRDERRRNIEDAARQQGASIDARSNEALRTSIANVKTLNTAREQALAALDTPARLDEIASERLKNGTALGEIRQKIHNPLATEQTRVDHRKAVEEANRWAEDLNKAQRITAQARESFDAAKAGTDKVLIEVSGLEREARGLSDRVEQLQAALTPQPGSLLEFIRSGEPSVWAGAAKLLEPSLLARTDLQPVLMAEVFDVPAKDGEVIVGPVSLSVQDVDTPAWFDMQEVRERLAQTQAQSTEVAHALANATARAKQLGGLAKQAESAFQSAKANESLADSAFETAREKRSRLDKVIQEEENAFKESAVKEGAALNERNLALDAEERRIKQGMEAARQVVRADFDAQLVALELGDKEAEARFKSEKDAVQTRLDGELARLQDDYDRQLAGLGLDPQRVASLESAIYQLGEQLDKIAANRHEVKAWREFCVVQLPSLDSDQSELDRLEERTREMGKQLQAHRDQLEALTTSARETLRRIDERMDSRKREVLRLEGLVTGGLKDFLDHVPSNLHIDWSVPDLETTIKQRRNALDEEVQELQKDTRSLRNEIVKHPGGPADWLDLKERDLPDRQILLPHQYLCEQGQVLLDWFDPMESGPYIDQLNKEMMGFFNLAGEFVRVLDQFERRVHNFNSELSKALSETKRFERFRDLSVTVSSTVGQLGYINVLRQMQDKGARNPMAYRTVMRTEHDIPSDEDAVLVRAFRDILQSDGGFKINLNEQVRLECTLYENGQRRTVSNEDEFRSISSNGNSALITAMFLMGFVQMIRGDAPVRLTWVTDEIGRFDPKNLGAFLQTLDQHKIDVISACPSIDPALARFFPRLCIFEGNGAIYTTEQKIAGATHGKN